MPEFFEYPPTRSNRAKWALEELGLNYTSRLVDFSDEERQLKQYKKIHPLGHVPAYRTANYTIHESVAIVMQLLDEHPDSGLSPTLGSSERAEYYQWCIFSCAEMDPLLFDVMKHTMHLPEEMRVPEIALRAQQGFAARAEMLSKFLEDREYLVGKKFSGADIAMGYCFNWAEYTGLIDAYPLLVNYYSRLQQRPAFQKVFSR